MSDYTLVLSLPSPALSPNCRAHYMTKARAVKAYREEARIQALKAIRVTRRPAPKMVEAKVGATFFFALERRRDPDNLLASIKSAFDGIVDSGMLADDNKLTHLPAQIGVDRYYPRLVITVTDDKR